MNEISIIINGVRYDAVVKGTQGHSCYSCDLYGDCLSHCCEDLIGLNHIFKKSDKNL